MLGAALLHATWNALLKASTDKQLDTVALSVGAGIVAIAVVPWLSQPAPASWPWLVGSATVHILYFLFLAGAYRWGALSYTYPIMRGGGPVIVTIFGALLLREVLPLKEMIAIALICAGILSFATGTHDRRATLFALANACVIGTYTLIDAEGARASGSPVAYTLWFFVANGVAIYGFHGARRGAEVPRYLARHWARALAGAVFSIGSYAIALWAMTRAPVALVAALRETSVVFAAAIGALALKERFTRWHALATVAVLGGLVTLRL